MVGIVNLVIKVYKPNGTTVFGPLNLNDAFSESRRPSFLAILAVTSIQRPNTSSRLFSPLIHRVHLSHTDIGVLTSNGDFVTVFQLDTTDATNPGCPCFGDQPLFGIDQYNVYISNNEFSILGPEFDGAQIYAISKSQLVKGNPSPNFVHFGNLGIGGTIAASVEPAITVDTNAPAEYFLNSLDPFGTFDNRVGVWAMTNRQVVSTGGIPNLSSKVITSEAYGFPPNAETPVGI